MRDHDERFASPPLCDECGEPFRMGEPGVPGRLPGTMYHKSCRAEIDSNLEGEPLPDFKEE
jgi:hypothetical protein